MTLSSPFAIEAERFGSINKGATHATIGRFKRQDDGVLVGDITTMTIYRRVRIVPVKELTERGLVYQIYSGNGELGAVFERTGKTSGDTYLSVVLDDPTWERPIFGALFPHKDDPNAYRLDWRRPEERQPA